MKKWILLIATNIAIMLMLSITAHVLGVDRWITQKGINMGSLLVFCALMGFGGAFVSLAMSKVMAKWTTGARIINGSEGPRERWLVGAVQKLSEKAGIAMPEVAIYEGSPNAFATGPSKNNALVAVSTGLLQVMSQDEVEAVLAHEVAHAANSDMVTMTLVQGVMNTFVMFIARAVGYAVDQFLRSNDDEREGHSSGIGYMITVIVLELVLGLLAGLIVAAFSRKREFRADEGAARLMGQSQSMINALKALGRMESEGLPEPMKAFGISGSTKGWMEWMASHPSLEDRIRALENHKS